MNKTANRITKTKKGNGKDTNTGQLSLNQYFTKVQKSQRRESQLFTTFGASSTDKGSFTKKESSKKKEISTKKERSTKKESSTKRESSSLDLRKKCGKIPLHESNSSEDTESKTAESISVDEDMSVSPTKIPSNFKRTKRPQQNEEQPPHLPPCKMMKVVDRSRAEGDHIASVGGGVKLLLSKGHQENEKQLSPHPLHEEQHSPHSLHEERLSPHPLHEEQLSHHPLHEEQFSHHPLHEEQLSPHPLHEEQLSHHPLHEEQLSPHPLHEEQHSPHPLHEERLFPHPLHEEQHSPHPLHEEQLSPHPLHEEQLSHHPLHEEQLSHHPLHEEQLSHHPLHEEQHSHHPLHEEQLSHHPLHETITTSRSSSSRDGCDPAVTDEIKVQVSNGDEIASFDMVVEGSSSSTPHQRSHHGQQPQERERTESDPRDTEPCREDCIPQELPRMPTPSGELTLKGCNMPVLTPKKCRDSASKASAFLFASPPPSVRLSPPPPGRSAVKRQLMSTLQQDDVSQCDVVLSGEDNSQPIESTVIDPSFDLFGENYEDIDELFASMDSGDLGDFQCSLLEPYNLFTVDSVTDEKEQRAKILFLSEKKTEPPSNKQCILQGDWYFLDVAPGDEVRLIDPIIDTCGNFIVGNDHESYVILNPDCLIGATTVANAVTCPRKAVLAEVFKGGLQQEGSGREAMVMGSLLHSVFEKVLRRAQDGENVTKESVSALTRDIVLSPLGIESLYAIDMSETEALEKLSEYSFSIVDWVSKYVHAHPQPGKGDIDFKRPVSDLLSTEETSCLCVSDVIDIEENIWAPRFGLKGKIDATVEVKIHRFPKKSLTLPTRTPTNIECSRIPFELKTGKMWNKLGSSEHRAQIILYTLMMKERYNVDVQGGLLHYLKGRHMQGIPAFPREKRALLMLRNQIAANLSNRSGTTLPSEMLGEARICKRCSNLSQCCLYHKVVEGGNASSSKIETIFESTVGHLLEEDLEFFKKWFRLVDREIQFSLRKRPVSDIWRQDVKDRILAGVCVCGLKATSHSSVDESRILQVFSVDSDETVIPVETMSVGERVVVSGEDGHSWAVATGYVREVERKSITILVDRVLSPLETYRVDILNHTGSHSMWVNIANLMRGDGPRESRLRDLLIRLEEPAFLPSPPETDVDALEEVSALNPEQRQAVRTCICAKDYLLIQGMPGTGKTTTLAILIQVLVARGKTVLFTSYTNMAVDNLLLKLRGVDYIRVGGTSSTVHPGIREHTTSVLAMKCTSVRELGLLYEKAPVVGATCLGVHHQIFSKRHFDYCIVDEATQVTLPTILGPLLLADKFVLVGDHYQLPPLVQDKEARREGLGTSLFKTLCEAHPKALVQLRRQFRMNSDIMTLSNSLIYDNQLVIGNNAVATAILNIPLWSEKMEIEGTDGDHNAVWIWQSLDPKQPVVFIDTDKHTQGTPLLLYVHHLCFPLVGLLQLPAEESSSSSGDKWNRVESCLVATLIHVLISCGVHPGSVGVITPYRQQQKAITETLKGLSLTRSSLTSCLVNLWTTSTVISDTPTVGPQFESDTPTIGPHFGSDTPTIGPHFGSDTPTIGPHFGSDTPTVGPHFGSDTPTVGPHFESDTSTVGPHFGSDTPTVGPHFESDTPTVGPHSGFDSASLSLRGIEVNTVDKYQGRDKDCIIVSFVRSNKMQQVGVLLEDISRINVALTRAKHKLILIGSRETLSSSPFFCELLAILSRKGWVVHAEPIAR